VDIDLISLEKKINTLCTQKGITVSKMLKEAGLSKSVCDNIKRGRVPSSQIILTIATHLGTTTDYLLSHSSSNSLTWLRQGLLERVITKESDHITDTQLAKALESISVLLSSPPIPPA